MLLNSAANMALCLTHRASELIEEVSRNLRPAPRIREAADAIVTELTADGAAFNGVHLRVEADANFKAYAGSAEVCRQPPVKEPGLPASASLSCKSILEPRAHALGRMAGSRTASSRAACT